jgi:hypothetical protein
MIGAAISSIDYGELRPSVGAAEIFFLSRCTHATQVPKGARILAAIDGVALLLVVRTERKAPGMVSAPFAVFRAAPQSP